MQGRQRTVHVLWATPKIDSMYFYVHFGRLVQYAVMQARHLERQTRCPNMYILIYIAMQYTIFVQFCKICTGKETEM